MSRFVLIGSASEFEQRLRSAVKGSLPGEVHTLDRSALSEEPQAIIAQLLPEQPEVLVLGPDLPFEDVVRLATIIDIQFPEISLVLVSESSPDLVLQAMRAGIRDVLDPQADPATICLLLERACQAFASRSRTGTPASPGNQEQGRVVGVFSPKGGVGKTTVATNLAVGLGKIAPMNVVLVDLDLQFGDVASGLYLTPEYTVTDAVKGSASQDSMVLKAFLTPHPAGIYALCAPKSPVEADQISVDQVGRLLKQLAAEFQYVVVDTGPGLSENNLAALEHCTDAVWVMAMDVPSVRGMRTGLDILRPLDLLPATQHMVLNFADSKTGLSVQDIEATLRAPVNVTIARSRGLPVSTNRGVPILQEKNRDAAAKGLSRLVRRFDPASPAKPVRRIHRRVVV